VEIINEANGRVDGNGFWFLLIIIREEEGTKSGWESAIAITSFGH
jgi:hypothetical protein